MLDDPGWGTSPLAIYDIQANLGRERVNGVQTDGSKYGTPGRTTVDGSATGALRLMTEVLSYDTGLDFLKRVNTGILAKYRTSQDATITAEEYRVILDEVAHGRTIDGQVPGDWLFAQPVANTKGSAGLYLTMQPGRPIYLDGSQSWTSGCPSTSAR